MNKSLATKEFIAALLIVAIFAAYGLAGLQYGLGSALQPGPGLVPRTVGIVGLLLGLWMLGAAIRGPGDSAYDRWTRDQATRAIGFPASIVVATLVTPYLGHVTSLALMVAFDARLLGVGRWTHTLLLGLGAGFAAWVIFTNILNAGLVAGPLGF